MWDLFLILGALRGEPVQVYQHKTPFLTQQKCEDFADWIGPSIAATFHKPRKFHLICKPARTAV